MKATFTILIAGVLLAAVATAETPAPPVPKDATWTTENGEDTFFTCPVCSMIHTMDEAKAAAVVEGTRYYLCHPNEQAKIRANPTMYLAQGYFVPMNLVTFDRQRGAAFRDPVTGAVDVLSEATVHHDLDGHQRYFFTSAETRDRFVADPNEYVEVSPAGE